MLDWIGVGFVFGLDLINKKGPVGLILITRTNCVISGFFRG